MNDLKKIENISNELLDGVFLYYENEFADETARESFRSLVVDVINFQNRLSEWREKHGKK